MLSKRNLMCNYKIIIKYKVILLDNAHIIQCIYSITYIDIKLIKNIIHFNCSMISWRKTISWNRRKLSYKF